jgi:pimeloyl-ACP methyl ester carboxylesterase
VTDGLLFLHGWPLDGSMWDEQVSATRGRWPVVAPHLPGFGGTDAAGPVMTMEAAAHRALGALDDEGFGRAVVCGISMGGYVAFELWRRHRDRIAGFVLANTRSEADNDEGRAKRLALAERLRTEGSGFLLEHPPALLTDAATSEVRERVMRILAEQTADAIAAASIGMAERPDSTPDLASIDVPTAVVTSTGDALIPSGMTTPLADRIAGAELSVLEGAGHLSNLEDPAGFNGAVERTVARSFR